MRGVFRSFFFLAFTLLITISTSGTLVGSELVRPTLSAHSNGQPNGQPNLGMAVDPTQVAKSILSLPGSKTAVL